MAVNETRSLNRELAEGITDGVVKKLTPDRGGVTDSASVVSRNHSFQQQYGVTPDPDGGTVEARRLTTVRG
jgi:hypothetical protein